MAALDETFGAHGEIIRVAGREMSRNDLESADVLLVRSVTPVGPRLLEGTPVRFVGTATIGLDHMDTDWLDAAGIAWASAPGCNADAAAQYALGMMMLACQRLGRAFSAQRVGIIGRGNVGSRLQALLEALEVQTVACDPPLVEQGVRGLVTREEALDRDIVSLHVPLTRSGPHATRRMIDAKALAAMRPGALLVNTARGAVVAAAELLQWLTSGSGYAALDCWPGEPDIHPALLDAALVATPHVAGYSEEGKRRGTQMIYRAFCRHFGLAERPCFEPAEATIDAPVSRAGDCRSFAAGAVLAACGTERDDAEMRRRAGTAGFFDTLRREYRQRREFQSTRLRVCSVECAPLLKRLGFRTPRK